MSDQTPSYFRAVVDFNFGGVQVKKGDIVPCHRKPWSALLDFGRMYVEAVAEPEDGARD